MDETKPPQSAYSGERTTTTGPNSLRSKTATAEPPVAANPEASTAETPKIQTTAVPGSSANTGRSGMTTASAHSPAADFVDYLNRTKWVWLGLAGAGLAFMALVTVQKGMAERARIAQEKRRETAAATVTPENLITRCGAAAEDATKEMYPVVLRTMVYTTPGSERIVFEFSRTAEEKSDWVFLSMKNESGGKKYDTPEEKVAGLPCLDAKK